MFMEENETTLNGRVARRVSPVYWLHQDSMLRNGIEIVSGTGYGL